MLQFTVTGVHEQNLQSIRRMKFELARARGRGDPPSAAGAWGRGCRERSAGATAIHGKARTASPDPLEVSQRLLAAAGGLEPSD